MKLKSCTVYLPFCKISYIKEKIPYEVQSSHFVLVGSPASSSSQPSCSSACRVTWSSATQLILFLSWSVILFSSFTPSFSSGSHHLVSSWSVILFFSYSNLQGLRKSVIVSLSPVPHLFSQIVPQLVKPSDSSCSCQTACPPLILIFFSP